MTGQNAFDFGWRDDYYPEAFVIAECNALPYRLATRPDLWAMSVLVLNGPKRSGKTYLAKIFSFTQKIDWEEGIISAEPKVAVIDNVDLVLLGNPEKQEALFHAINHVNAHGGRLLLTASNPVKEWVALPDLQSRLDAAQHVLIDFPDDKILKECYHKLFLNNGLNVDFKVIDYLVSRGDRSFDFVAETAKKLDILSLQTKRKITIPLVAEMLLPQD